MLAYDYSERRALLNDPSPGEMSPHLYALCTPCAEKLRPPKGWTLEDQRVAPPLFADFSNRRHLEIAETRAEAAPGAEPVRRQLFFGSSS